VPSWAGRDAPRETPIYKDRPGVGSHIGHPGTRLRRRALQGPSICAASRAASIRGGGPREIGSAGLAASSTAIQLRRSSSTYLRDSGLLAIALA
jgi:hypothetical protein